MGAMNEREIARLLQRVAKLEQLVAQLVQPKSVARLIVPIAANVKICKNGGSAITGRSGATISYASCTVYSGSGGSLASTAASINVYNLSTTAIAANAYLVAVYDGEIWVAVWEDC